MQLKSLADMERPSGAIRLKYTLNVFLNPAKATFLTSDMQCIRLKYNIKRVNSRNSLRCFFLILLRAEFLIDMKRFLKSSFCQQAVFLIDALLLL